MDSLHPSGVSDSPCLSDQNGHAIAGTEILLLVTFLLVLVVSLAVIGGSNREEGELSQELALEPLDAHKPVPILRRKDPTLTPIYHNNLNKDTIRNNWQASK